MSGGWTHSFGSAREVCDQLRVPFDALDNYEIRPIHYLSPQRRLCVVSIGIDWREELQWLRELSAECDALDAWENEGGSQPQETGARVTFYRFGPGGFCYQRCPCCGSIYDVYHGYTLLRSRLQVCERCAKTRDLE